MRIPALACILVAPGAMLALEQPAPAAPIRPLAPLPGYVLAWSDEFDGETLDADKWGYRTGARLLSFQKPENVGVAGGFLRIQLKKEDAGGLNYTAGGVISRQTFLYGYYEARLRCPRGAGWHTSFWTIKAHDTNGNPTLGAPAGDHPAYPDKAQEIDICEQDSVNHRYYTSGVIDWDKQPLVKHGREYYFDQDVPDFAADFHVFGCEFTPTAVTFYLDGKMTHRTDATGFPHNPQSIWLTSLACLSGRPKPPKHVDDSSLPAFADFDWVRYFAKP